MNKSIYTFIVFLLIIILIPLAILLGPHKLRHYGLKELIYKTITKLLLFNKCIMFFNILSSFFLHLLKINENKKIDILQQMEQNLHVATNETHVDLCSC